MKFNLPFNGEYKFKYIIFTPSKKDEDEIFNSTIFNRISYRYIDSIIPLNFIKYFPATLIEFLSDWPKCVCNYYIESNYDITYVIESLIDDKFLEFIENTELGILFISGKLDTNLIKRISKISKMPIVMFDASTNNKDFYDISEKSIYKIYEVFYSKFKEYASKHPKNIFNKMEYIKIKDTHNEPYISPKAKYLEALTVTLDRIRGLYSKCGTGIYKIPSVYHEVHEEYEKMADEEINKVLKRIIAEKFLILMFGFIEEDSLDQDYEIQLEKIRLNKNALSNFLLKRDKRIYKYLSDEIYNNVDNIDFLTNMVLCVPSVNYEFIRAYFSKDILGKDYRKFSKEIFRLNYDMDTYYGLIKNSLLEKEEDFKLAIDLFNQKGAEITYLSYIYIFLTLSHKDPYIRTRNVPAYNIWNDMKRLNDLISNNESAYLKVKEINEIIKSVSDNIKKQIFNKANDLEKIIYKFASHVTILSDLPVEWIKINDVPMCITKKMSRIPITPGDYLINFIQNSKTPCCIGLNNIKILIINALSSKDSLKRYGELLNNNLKNAFGDYNYKIKYVEVKNKDEYIEVINKIKPNILIHYGHGKYEGWDNKDFLKMSGGLLINEEFLTIDDINRIETFPKIVILGACNTEVTQGPFLNVANTFLARGCLSVIGAFVPVDANYTVYFISNIIEKTYMFLTDKSNDNISNWSDVIRIIRTKMYIEEPVYCLSIDYKKGKLKSLIQKFNPIEKFLDYCDKNRISTEEALQLRNKIFYEVFKDDEVLASSFKNLETSNSIVPYTMFYTSIGSPEKIQIGDIDYI